MKYGDKGAIFDWDGIIIDSHDHHEAAWADLIAETGHRVPDDFMKRSFGMRNEQIFPEFFEGVEEGDHALIRDLADQKETHYRNRLRRDGIDPLPGVREILDTLAAHEVPCAVGTSTPLENVNLVMELTGLRGCFAAISSAEDVRFGKPDPEVFLVAAGRIKRDPAQCVVFEDAHVGLEAGRRAGMRTIGVATTHPIDSLEAELAVTDLAGLTLADLFPID